MTFDRCKSCGGEVSRNGNYYACKHCGNKWIIDADNDVHVIDRANAWAALRDCDFERAVELFENIMFKEPENHESYWGRALAAAGIMYVTDLDENKKVPTCNNIREESFVDSNDVKKAIALAPQDIAETYKQQAEQIEAIRVEWVKKASKEKPYDIFICYKDSDREHGIDRTDDSYDAHELYNVLTAEGYKVFFSRVSLKSKVSEHYEPYIYNALKTAKVMIVFGEKPEYFNAVWVKNEWMRFRKRIELGEKHPNSLVVVYKNMSPADLPAGLRSRQSLDAGDMTFLEVLKKHIAGLKQATLERIEVKGRAVGKKVTAITDTIEIMEAGTSVVAQKPRLAQTEVSKRNVATLAGAYVPSANDAVQMGVSLLRLGSFFEADMFLTEGINESKQNGTAWLGLLCAKLNDANLYDVLTAPELTIQDVRENADKISECIEELTYAVDYAAEKYVAENILEYLFAVICHINEEKKSSIDKLLSFILQYESNVYERVVQYANANIAIWASFFPISEYESICDTLLKHSANTDTYISVVENIIDGYSSAKNYSQAQVWNRRLLEIHEGNFNAVHREILLSVGTDNVVDFKQKGEGQYLADQYIVPFLEKSIKQLSKENAEFLLDFIGEVEYSCLTKGDLNNAEIYFDFVSKYKFPSREELLVKHKTEIEFLAERHRPEFFEKIMATISHEHVDWHISKRLEYANKARSLRHFDEAKTVYHTVLSLEEDNADALDGLFACNLGFNGSDGYRIQWKHFDVPEFEKILAACPNKEKQTSILQQYANACILSVKADLFNYDRCCKAFDQLIKYFPESESKSVFGYVDDLSDAFLKKGEFELAIKYANLSISNEPTYNINARHVILLATLGCKNEEGFIKCENFDKNMSEYKMLLLSCRSDANALQKYTLLAKKNEDGVELLKQQRLEQKQREEEEAIHKKAMRKKSSKCLMYGLSNLLLSIITFVIAIALAMAEDRDGSSLWRLGVFIVCGITFIYAIILCSDVTELLDASSTETVLLNTVDKHIRIAKTMLIIGSIALGAEVGMFFLDPVQVGCILLLGGLIALIALLVVLLIRAAKVEKE